MRVEATTDGPRDTGADTVAVGVFEGEGVAHDLPGAPLQALLDSGEAGREAGRLAVTHADGRRFVLAGLGSRERWDGEAARVAGAKVHGRARELRAQRLCWEVPHHVGEETVAGLVEGTMLHAYRFDRFKRASNNHELDSLVLSAHHDIAAGVARASAVTAAQNRARDLGNLPPNELTPLALAEYAGGVQGVSVTIHDGDDISASGMGAFAAVAQGSAQPAQLIELRYDGGGDPDTPLLALVGKAVTFDSGGLAIKAASSMHEMKFDMCGGAAVIEAIGALAALRAPVRVLGLVGATENMLSGRAMRPSDIVTALDGTTIEINNPDAEGRLVLADCFTHARRLGAGRLVDVATLTGAITTALGTVYAGLMSNDDAWAASVLQAGERAGEPLWRLPVHERYAEMIRGRYADLTNRAERREAQAITAAEFLHHFAGDVPWAHLDIAAMSDDVPRPYFDKGATGFGVRLLVELAWPRGG